MLGLRLVLFRTLHSALHQSLQTRPPTDSFHIGKKLMPNVTTLTLPSNGRIPIWTGLTQSGEIRSSILALPNRTVQLHFRSNDDVNDFSAEINDSVFSKLSTFMYEFTMRHFGLMSDELQPVNFVIPQLNDNGMLFGQFRQHNNSINHLRFTASETIGREFCVGCPEIGNAFAQQGLQATEFLYTHHHTSSLNVLILKITISNASREFINDFRNDFPLFQFNTPMNYRDHFKIIDRNHIFRNGWLPLQKFSGLMIATSWTL